MRLEEEANEEGGRRNWEDFGLDAEAIPGAGTSAAAASVCRRESSHRCKSG
jgi:hypothetical protein